MSVSPPATTSRCLALDEEEEVGGRSALHDIVISDDGKTDNDDDVESDEGQLEEEEKEDDGVLRQDHKKIRQDRSSSLYNSVSRREGLTNRVSNSLGEELFSSGASGKQSCSKAVQYDPQDHTASIDAGRRATSRYCMMALPRCLLPTSMAQQFQSAQGLHGQEGGSDERREEEGGGGDGSGRPSCSAATAMASSLLEAPGQPLSSLRLVRLPHPRHGQPALFAIDTSAEFPTATAAAVSSMAYEVQVQSPQNGYAQTWCVGDSVIGGSSTSPSPLTSGGIVVLTPFDIRWFALREFFKDEALSSLLQHRFIPAGDIWPLVERCTASIPEMPPPLPAQRKGDYTSVFGHLADANAEDTSCSEEEDAKMDGEDSGFAFRMPSSATSAASSASRVDGRTGESSADLLPRSFDVSHGQNRKTSAVPSLPSSCREGDRGRDRKTKSSGDDWWPGWAAAAAATAVLRPCFAALQSPAVLSTFAEVAAATEGTSSNCYRLTQRSAVAWIQAKVRRVQSSAVMREMLQLPPGGTVPVELAVAAVVEYVPEVLHDAVAAACGVVAASGGAKGLGPLAASSTAGGVGESSQPRRDRVGAVVEKKAAPSGPKSVSVRRLEKAGRPKGTPTLLSMFAKKKKEEEEK